MNTKNNLLLIFIMEDKNLLSLTEVINSLFKYSWDTSRSEHEKWEKIIKDKCDSIYGTEFHKEWDWNPHYWDFRLSHGWPTPISGGKKCKNTR